MRKKYMKVTVTGLPQSGKTVLADFIGDILSSRGFDVLMETDEEEYTNGQQQAAIAALAEAGMQIIVQAGSKAEKEVARRRFHGKRRNNLVCRMQEQLCLYGWRAELLQNERARQSTTSMP